MYREPGGDPEEGRADPRFREAAGDRLERQVYASASGWCSENLPPD